MDGPLPLGGPTLTAVRGPDPWVGLGGGGESLVLGPSAKPQGVQQNTLRCHVTAPVQQVGWPIPVEGTTVLGTRRRDGVERVSLVRDKH